MLSFLKKIEKKDILIILCITIIAILLRVIWLDIETEDYTIFLKVWIEKIRALGNFGSLKYNIGNYNVPYVVILTLISLLKYEPLIPIKIVSILFDFICAIYSAKIVKISTKNKSLAIYAYGLVLILPTVIINSSLWGQCDSIYTSFILISLYHLLKKEYTKSFVFLGISFAFKLQFIFILPLYIIMLFREKEIHIYHFLIIPITNIVLSLPAIFAGRSIKSVFMIYVNQTTEYNALVLNFPNIYNFIQENINFFVRYSKIISKIGILFTIFLFFMIWLYVLVKKVKFDKEKIIILGIWSIVIATFFLPHMHERYMYVADILSVVYFLSFQKHAYLPFTINTISTLTYAKFLFEIKLLNYIDYKLLATIYFIIIFIFTFHVIKVLNSKIQNF